MTVFRSILVPLDGSRTSTRSLWYAIYLAGQLGSELHILSATGRPLPARQELARLGVPEEHWQRIMLHQDSQYPVEAILAAIRRHGAELVVMTSLGQSADAEDADRVPGGSWPVGSVSRVVLERSPVPVLLVPPGCRQELPWTRAMVPLGGATQSHEALALAVRLAEALDLSVHVVHVIDTGEGTEGLAAAARYADAAHHEYPRQLEELVDRALPRASDAQARRIECVALGRGEVAERLRELVDQRDVSVLVLGWEGWLAEGHARILKRLLADVTVPALLVKPSGGGRFRLKVGEELE